MENNNSNKGKEGNNNQGIIEKLIEYYLNGLLDESPYGPIIGDSREQSIDEVKNYTPKITPQRMKITPKITPQRMNLHF